MYTVYRLASRIAMKINSNNSIQVELGCFTCSSFQKDGAFGIHFFSLAAAYTICGEEMLCSHGSFLGIVSQWICVSRDNWVFIVFSRDSWGL